MSQVCQEGNTGTLSSSEAVLRKRSSCTSWPRTAAKCSEVYFSKHGQILVALPRGSTSRYVSQLHGGTRTHCKSIFRSKGAVPADINKRPTLVSCASAQVRSLARHLHNGCLQQLAPVSIHGGLPPSALPRDKEGCSEFTRACACHLQVVHRVVDVDLSPVSLVP